MEITGPELGERVAALRDHRGWPLQKVADLANVSPSYIDLLEKGNIGQPRPNTLVAFEKVAMAFGWPSLKAMMATDALDPLIGRHLEPTQTPPDLHESGLSGQYAGERDPGEGRAKPAVLGQGIQAVSGMGPLLPARVFRGFELGGRDDPRQKATWPVALSENRRRTLEVGVSRKVGLGEAAFAVLVNDGSVSHIASEGGTWVAGWTLYVNPDRPELMYTGDHAVVAMNRTGTLVAGWLTPDTGVEDGGWLIEDAYNHHAVAPDGLIGPVVLDAAPSHTRHFRRT